jgi:hypothetical protein
MKTPESTTEKTANVFGLGEEAETDANLEHEC